MNYPYYIIKKTQIEELFIFQIETPKNSVQSLDLLQYLTYCLQVNYPVPKVIK